MKSALLILTLLIFTLPAQGKQSLNCKGDLFLFNDTFGVMPLNNPRQDKSALISLENGSKLKVAFERTRGVVKVDPWNGMGWNKMAFAYNENVRFQFSSDGLNWFKVKVNYEGKEKVISCKKRSLYRL